MYGTYLTAAGNVVHAPDSGECGVVACDSCVSYAVETSQHSQRHI